MAEEMKELKDTQETERDEEYVIKLKKPYVFEDKEYPEIDLNGLKKMTIEDGIQAQKALFNGQEMAAVVLAEASTSFARAIAARAAGLPEEFFELARLDVSRAVKATVMGYLNTDMETQNHVMKFEEPYVFNGKTYTEVDLRKVGDLTSLNVSEAENRMAQEGLPAANADNNFIYVCVIASMASGLPEEFFRGLPLKEIMKLKSAVNDQSFFE